MLTVMNFKTNENSNEKLNKISLPNHRLKAQKHNVYKCKEVAATERYNLFVVILIVIKIDRIVGCQQSSIHDKNIFMLDHIKRHT
jgi:hypothetical protein